MSRGLRKVVNEWLAREAAEGSMGAEKALTRVFRRLPAPAPPPGFARQVLRRAGISTAPAGRFWPAPVMVLRRATLALSLLLSAAALAVVPGMLLPILAQLRPGLLLALAADSLVGAGQRFAEGVAVWGALSSIGQVLSAFFGTPYVLASLALAGLVSIAAFRALHQLMIPSRRSGYV